MSADHTITTHTETDTPMFPGTPSWERGRKRRRFSSPRAVPAGILAADALATPVSMTETTHIDTGPPSTRVVKRSGPSAAAIAGGILAVAGVALAGWFAIQQPKDEATNDQLAAALAADAATAPLPAPTVQVAPLTTPVSIPTIVAPPMAVPAPAPPRVVVVRQAPAPIAPVAPVIPAPEPPSVNASVTAPRPITPAPEPAPTARLEVVPAPEVAAPAPTPAPAPETATPVIVPAPEPESPA